MTELRIPTLPELQNPVCKTTFGPDSAITWVPGAAAGASGTIGTANCSLWYPTYFPKPFPVSALFWENGATTGTDSVDMGVYKMTNLATSRCDLLRSAGATLSAGTANTPQAVTAFRVARTGLTSGASTTDGTTFTTASVTLKAGRLYLLAFTNTKASAADAATSADTTGAALSFTSASSITFGTTTEQRLSVFRAMPATDVTDTIVITFPATATGCAWSLIEFSGVDQSGTNGSGAIVQTPATNTSNSATTITATLSAFGSANNCTYGASANGGGAATTPGSGFTEIHDVNYATPTANLETEWRVDNDTTVDATWTSGICGVIGIEIKADTSAFIIPAGMHYVVINCNGTTATFIRTGSTLIRGKAQGVQELTSSFPLPSVATPVALTAQRSTVLCGVARRTTI